MGAQKSDARPRCKLVLRSFRFRRLLADVATCGRPLMELAARPEFLPASVSPYWFCDPTLPLDHLPRLCGISSAGLAGRG